MNDLTLQTPIENYRGYQGLPPLVGLHTMAEAIDVGLTVEEAVGRLKYLHWSLRRLHGIFIGRVASMPVYELKMAFSLHGHYCIEHAESVFDRVREMRQPPYGLDRAPHEAVDLFFDEIQQAPDTAALVLGLYQKAVPQLVAALRDQIEKTNRLHEHPTFRVLRYMLLELEEVETYGTTAVQCLVGDEARARHGDWLALLDRTIARFGGFTGTGETGGGEAERLFSRQPYVYDGNPRRDERFRDCYNMGVNAEVFLHDDKNPAKAKTLMLYFKRLREIDVPEMMSSIISETPGKPIGYYVGMTRQLWDEARHAMMGELGFVANGIDWTKIPINFTFSLELNTRLKPEERHAILFFIEQGLMPKETGKEKEWEIAVASADSLSQKIQDYDWADEILHAKIGRDWFVKEMGGQAKAMEFGSTCWDRVHVLVPGYKAEGLTGHRNWWPELYTTACRNWGVEPDPAVLAYSTDYCSLRADLKTVDAN